MWYNYSIENLAVHGICQSRLKAVVIDEIGLWFFDIGFPSISPRYEFLHFRIDIWLSLPLAASRNLSVMSTQL